MASSSGASGPYAVDFVAGMLGLQLKRSPAQTVYVFNVIRNTQAHDEGIKKYDIVTEVGSLELNLRVTDDVWEQLCDELQSAPRPFTMKFNRDPVMSKDIEASSQEKNTRRVKEKRRTVARKLVAESESREKMMANEAIKYSKTEQYRLQRQQEERERMRALQKVAWENSRMDARLQAKMRAKELAAKHALEEKEERKKREKKENSHTGGQFVVNLMHDLEQVRGTVSMTTFSRARVRVSPLNERAILCLYRTLPTKSQKTHRHPS